MKNTHIIILSIVQLIIIAAIGGFLYKQIPKTAYVDLNKVFQEFNGTKELDGYLKKTENKQRAILDSLELELHAIRAALDKGGNDNGKALLISLQDKQTLYQQLSTQFSIQYKEQDEKFANEVWGQINQYIRDFGERESYDYIHGANGDGSLMYGGKSKDITDDIIQFLNSRYDGV